MPQQSTAFGRPHIHQFPNNLEAELKHQGPYSDFQSSGASKVHMGFPDISFWISPKKVCLVRRGENSSRKGGAVYISNRSKLHACITLSRLDEQTHERSAVAFWKIGGPISSGRFGGFLEKTQVVELVVFEKPRERQKDSVSQSSSSFEEAQPW
jgi:hypothetical protein